MSVRLCLMETIDGWLIERLSTDNSSWYARSVNGSRKYHVSYSPNDGTFLVRNDHGVTISTSNGLGAGMLNAIRLSHQWIHN